MQLEDYFDFLPEGDIRIKGHRIGIEDVIYEYTHNTMAVEELAQRFPTLTYEELYATLLYYHRNKEKMDAYITEWIEMTHLRWLEQQRNPTPTMLRLRALKAERELLKVASSPS